MGAITKVRKANRIIRVTDNELDRYLANGYEIVTNRATAQPEQAVPVAKEKKLDVVDAPTPKRTPRHKK